MTFRESKVGDLFLIWGEGLHVKVGEKIAYSFMKREVVPIMHNKTIDLNTGMLEGRELAQDKHGQPILIATMGDGYYIADYIMLTKSEILPKTAVIREKPGYSLQQVYIILQELEKYLERLNTTADFLRMMVNDLLDRETQAS